jgi:D-alanine-D-alanine ligase
LHGSIGENGTIQGFLESLGIKYTGSNQLSSAICMDKNISKFIARGSKVITPDWRIVTRDQNIDEDNSEFPLVIKPNDQGSTVGLTIVHDESELGSALDLAFKYSSSVMVEQFIKGRELTVTLIGGKALPVCEIIPSHELYDYECKYTSGMSKYVCPADIELDLTKRIQEITERLFDVLKCRHYSRADFRMDHEDNLWFLEMNTLPGMTDTSLAPMTAKAAGLSFNDLIECIVLQAWSE